MKLKEILFLTGTRADFGKLKPLMKVVEENPSFKCRVFITGMHTLARYGNTAKEVYDAGFENTYMFMNQIHGEPMDVVLANTIGGLSRYVHENEPDMIVVHGDRIEALAGAIVGSLNNILVGHVEGGEISGTIDGLIRHSVSKLSHLHFVANEEAANLLKQMGEDPNTIYIIGSPDIDVMLSPGLPSINEVKKHYEIPFNQYGILAFHPNTIELEYIREYARNLVDALIETNMQYVVIYPNNDTGSHYIFESYERLNYNNNFKIFPSMRFESFLTLLKNSCFIIGNSSAGIREAPVYGIPSINIGTRQKDRFMYRSIVNTNGSKSEILSAIKKVSMLPKIEPCLHFGDGRSAEHFLNAIREKKLWLTSKQKKFINLKIS